MSVVSQLSSLETAFLANLLPELRDGFHAYDQLGRVLAALVASATELDPHLDQSRFVADIASRCDGALTPDRALATIRAADLALACACARGERDALDRFEAEIFGVIDAAGARFRNASLSRDELRQAMRDRLFVAADGAKPRIASYQGRGDLRSWVRMTAMRYLVDVVRADGARPDRVSGDDQLVDVASASDDPELAFLKQRYRVEFRAAFAEALEALEPRDRNMLRHRYLDELEMAELATIYGLHRVSMSRHLSKLRDQLLAAIRASFLRRFGIEHDELDGVMAQIQSQLELSLSGLLRG